MLAVIENKLSVDTNSMPKPIQFKLVRPEHLLDLSNKYKNASFGKRLEFLMEHVLVPAATPYTLEQLMLENKDKGPHMTRRAIYGWLKRKSVPNGNGVDRLLRFLPDGINEGWLKAYPGEDFPLLEKPEEKIKPVPAEAFMTGEDILSRRERELMTKFIRESLFAKHPELAGDSSRLAKFFPDLNASFIGPILDGHIVAPYMFLERAAVVLGVSEDDDWLEGLRNLMLVTGENNSSKEFSETLDAFIYHLDKVKALADRLKLTMPAN